MRAGGCGPGTGTFDVGPFRFERVSCFIYLGTEENFQNNSKREQYLEKKKEYGAVSFIWRQRCCQIYKVR